MNSYHNYAQYYDLFEGAQIEKIAFIKNILKNNAPSAKSVLEIACGTGTLMSGLQDSYDVEGLDISHEMLSHARKKNAKLIFYEQNMTEFQINKTYDVIFCMYDSINHVIDYAEWESTFNSVHAHLNPNGVFIFDMNTDDRLEALSNQEPWFHSVQDNHIAIEITRDKSKNNVYYWNAKIFIQEKDGRYLLQTECIKEAAYNMKKVKNTLEQKFKVLSIAPLNVSDDEFNNICFVCQTTSAS